MRTSVSFILLALFFVLPGRLPAQPDFWEQTQGPTGGSIMALTIRNDGLLVAGAFPGGIFKSIDGGSIWARPVVGPSKNYINALMATPEYLLVGTWGGGVFRSTDDGNTWLQSGIPDRVVLSFCLDSSGYVFAGGASVLGGGVFRSTDDGLSWDHYTIGLPTSSATALVVDPRGSVFAGTQGDGIYKSTDTGL